MSCNKCKCGPGYATPLEAMQKGPQEQLLYVTTIQSNLEEPHGDYLSTVDVDPDSPTYCQIIHRTFTNKKGNELHHSGWNTCSSCHFLDESAKQIPTRDKLILPCLMSDNIYVMDMAKNPRAPEIFKVIDGQILRDHNVSAPHTSHCAPNGTIVISTMGDAEGNSKGDFIVFDKNFKCLGTWTKGEKAICGYDFWYQPHFNIMAASEWGAPKLFRRGFQPQDIESEIDYGRRINFYKFEEQELIQSINLGFEGITPLEIRFLHNPKEPQGYVGCALNANVYRFYKKSEDSLEFAIEKVIDVPAKKVSSWNSEEITGMMTDILISLDDRFLYFSNWLHGDVRQYDITDRRKPKLTSQVFLGGSIQSDSNVKVFIDEELEAQPEPAFIKGRRLQGGPQMLQLSLDGKRLYVSSSLFSPWDRQFYPEMVQTGGTIVQLDIDTVNGGMEINQNFLVDFANEPYGPTLPHEMRYPGGDCTSDIWLVND